MIHPSSEKISATELDLLVDLSRLIKKHGIEPFEKLSLLLSHPDFSRQLADILSDIAKSAREVQQSRNQRVSKDSGKALERELLQVQRSDPERARILKSAYDELNSRTLLPSLQEVVAFAQDNGFHPLKTASRKAAVVELVGRLLALPTDEIEGRLRRARHTSLKSDRSLEGWSSIILAREEPPGDPEAGGYGPRESK